MFQIACQFESLRLKSASLIELDDGKIYRKALYLMVKTMVSCKVSLKPIQWKSRPPGHPHGRSLRKTTSRCGPWEMMTLPARPAPCSRRKKSTETHGETQREKSMTQNTWNKNPWKSPWKLRRNPPKRFAEDIFVLDIWKVWGKYSI